ncbi:MAG: PIG-L deacetylase family protein [Chloroflexota bacterium]
MAELKFKTAMAIVAHPDDAEFTVAGTVAKWAREGTRVVYVICTDGSKGTDDPSLTKDRLVPVREAEQRAAAAVLGVSEVVFLGHDDGTLEPSLSLRRDLSRQIRKYQPEACFCPDPSVRFRADYINHPDHRAAGEAALCALFPDARNRWQFPELLEEGLEPFAVKHIFLTGTQSPDVWFDISSTLDLKLKALAAHRSQVDATQEGVEERIRGWARLNAQGRGLEYAEAFRHIVLR